MVNRGGALQIRQSSAAKLRQATRQSRAQDILKKRQQPNITQPVSLEQQQEKLANEQQNIIDKRIENLQNIQERLERKASGPISQREAEQIDERLRTVTSEINAFTGVKGLATGQYTTDSLVSLAEQRAAGQVARISALKDAGITFQDIAKARSSKQVSVKYPEKRVNIGGGRIGIVKYGNLVVVEDILKGQSRAPTSREKAIFEIVGVPETQKKLLLTVEKAPNLKQQLRREIEQVIPELPLGGGKIDRVIEVLIGTGLGTRNFAKSKATRLLTDLKTSTGTYVFTPDQAQKIVDLGFEVAESYVLGAAAGKVSTLGKGAFAKILPKSLKYSSKLKGFKVLLDVGLSAGLGLLELNSLRKTYKSKGQSAALLQLVGLVSFGSGFSKTGLKTSTQAEKELDEAARKLKKLIPKDKRGELLRKKKKKKGILNKQELMTIEEAEEQEGILAAIERQLANAKGKNKEEIIKNQLKILVEIKNKLNTPIAEANFKKFVDDLINKGVVKLPSVTISDKGFETIEARSTLKVITPSAGNKEMVESEIIKNQKRIERTQIPLGVRYEESQKKKESTKFRSFQVDRSKLKTIPLLKSGQKLKTSQNQKSSQSSALALRSKTSLLQKNRQIQRRLSRNIRSRTRRKKPKFPIGIPKIKMDFEGIKKEFPKKIKSPLGAYSIFIRRRGKDILLGKEKGKEKAFKKLKSGLVFSLGASGFVKTGGKKVKPTITPGFRLSKTRKNVLVQKRKFRLSTTEEKREIQQARRNKLKSTPMIKFKK